MSRHPRPCSDHVDRRRAAGTARLRRPPLAMPEDQPGVLWDAFRKEPRQN